MLGCQASCFVVGALLAERLQELFGRDFGLTKQARQCTDLNLAVHRNNTAFCFTFHHDVAAALTNLCEPKPFESALDVGAQDVRQFRHALAQVP